MTDYHVEITLLSEMITREFTVPPSMQIGELASLSAQAFSTMTDSRYIPPKQPILTEEITCKAIDPNLVVQQTQIRNGTRLLLY